MRRPTWSLPTAFLQPTDTAAARTPFPEIRTRLTGLREGTAHATMPSCWYGARKRMLLRRQTSQSRAPAPRPRLRFLLPRVCNRRSCSSSSLSRRSLPHCPPTSFLRAPSVLGWGTAWPRAPWSWDLPRRRPSRSRGAAPPRWPCTTSCS
uniref:Uncharacterized protein n=1 Tax=Ixodes ricinus TaxID=34613 RepID=A0A6B0UVD4_IXORI